MASVAGSSSKEYWRPANPDIARLLTSPEGTCWHCGVDYAPGASFCHVCGSERQRSATHPRTPVPKLLARLLGLSLPSLAFLMIGVSCFIAAALTGLVYRIDTMADWQAVQLWRIEWLLAASAALLAGILLKKKST
ncbi:MAG TPA: zinc ribbon domain-containing protein [Candidatus Binatia bacterium]|nr:zinc ribbon domain-containing protein [Candidatus Binatia bacterium]